MEESIKDLEVHKNDGSIEESKSKELYDFLKDLPSPPVQANLNNNQKFWWYWFGQEFVKTNQFSKLDLPHLQKAAFWLDVRCEAIKEVNKKGYNGGIIQTFKTSAQQISPHITAIEKADKHLEAVSSHFGLSIKDRQKLQVKEVDDNQLSLFETVIKKLAQ